MYNYLDIPKEAIVENYIKKLIARVDNTILCLYANLVTKLGFVSPKITNL
jgi:hypothetical protein